MSKQLRVPLWLMNFYPPLIGAGIRVKQVSRANDRVVVEMKLTWWNANFSRTHFGGSLYMMLDPFYVLMLTHQLGPEYVVWDREATIHYRAPGRSKVKAILELPPSTVAEYRAKIDTHGHADLTLTTEIRDNAGTLVADATKVIHARKREDHQRATEAVAPAAAG